MVSGEMGKRTMSSERVQLVVSLCPLTTEPGYEAFECEFMTAGPTADCSMAGIAGGCCFDQIQDTLGYMKAELRDRANRLPWPSRWLANRRLDRMEARHAARRDAEINQYFES